MKRVLLMLGVCVCTTPHVFAAENERGVSVYDANPKCMERTANSAAPECLLFEEGVPRQYYPATITPVIPSPPVMPPAPPPAAREATGRTSPPTGGG